MSNVDAVIFTYLRPEHLQKQLESLRNQTHSLRNIIIAHLENDLTPRFDFEGLRVVTYNQDPGIRSTFISTALVEQGCDYIFLLNDDIAPGEKYVENVLSCMEQNEGAYGAFGMNIHEKNYYNRIFPRSHGNTEVEQVDAIGQSYFYPYSYLHLFLKEQMPEPWTSSDDLWFSYLLNKHGKKCYIAPHPANDSEMWSVKNNLAQNDPPEKKLHKRNPAHKKHRKQLIKYARGNDVWV